MIPDLNRIYTAETLDVAMSIAKRSVTLGGDSTSSSIQVVGTVIERIDIVGDLKEFYGFASSVNTFNNYLSGSPSLEEEMKIIEVDSGTYYAENCARLGC